MADKGTPDTNDRSRNPREEVIDETLEAQPDAGDRDPDAGESQQIDCEETIDVELWTKQYAELSRWATGTAAAPESLIQDVDWLVNNIPPDVGSGRAASQ